MVAALLCGAAVAAAENVTLTQLMMPHHYGWTSEYYAEMAARFEAAHPGVTIEVLPAASRPDYEDKVAVGTASGVIFDVMVPPALSWAQLAGQGFFVDMLPFIERDPDIDAEQFLLIARLAQTMGGQLLGLPIAVSTISPVINVPMFQEAGLETPSQMGSAWNWDALRMVGQRLSRDLNGDGQNDVWGIAHRLEYSRLIPTFVHNAGGDALDAEIDPRRATFVSDPAVEIGLEFFLDLYQRGYVTLSGNAYHEGKVGVDLSYLPESAIAFTYDRGNPWEYEVAHNPRGPARQGSEVLAFSYAIHRDTKYKDIAWEWIKFLSLDRDAVHGVMKAWGNPTANLAYLNDFFDLFPEVPPSFRLYGEIMQHPDARVQPVTPAYVVLQREFSQRLGPVLNGRESLRNFLVNMDTVIQAELDKWWGN